LNNKTRVAYLSTIFRHRAVSGANIHVNQFIDNVLSLGYDVFTPPSDEHPKTKKMPETRWERFLILRQMDVLYYRIESTLPPSCRWFQFPYYYLIGRPVIVWEFNTVPEFGQIVGSTEDEIKQTKLKFIRYGKVCALAICVSNALSNYVRDRLKIKNVITISNASDPNLFKPDAKPVDRIKHESDTLNVVWIGSANLLWHNFQLLKETAHYLYSEDNKKGRSILFHIIGPGFKDIQDMPPNVLYHGPVEYKKLPEWLTAMDVGLCLYKPGPADYSSPLKVFDYMSSGLTVVGTSQPQMEELSLQLDQKDLLVPPDDPKALARVLLMLSKNPAFLKKQGEAGRGLVLERYNWKKNAQDTMAAINKVLTLKRKYSEKP
jgi:glycosyltransferase involved in cell wall biosynthesis